MEDHSIRLTFLITHTPHLGTPSDLPEGYESGALRGSSPRGRVQRQARMCSPGSVDTRGGVNLLFLPSSCSCSCSCGCCSCSCGSCCFLCGRVQDKVSTSTSLETELCRTQRPTGLSPKKKTEKCSDKLWCRATWEENSWRPRQPQPSATGGDCCPSKAPQKSIPNPWTNQNIQKWREIHIFTSCNSSNSVSWCRMVSLPWQAKRDHGLLKPVVLIQTSNSTETSLCADNSQPTDAIKNTNTRSRRATRLTTSRGMNEIDITRIRIRSAQVTTLLHQCGAQYLCSALGWRCPSSPITKVHGQGAQLVLRSRASQGSGTLEGPSRLCVAWCSQNTLPGACTTHFLSWAHDCALKQLRVIHIAPHSHCSTCLCWMSRVVRSLMCCPHLRLRSQDPLRLPPQLQEVGATVPSPPQLQEVGATAQARPLAGMSLADWLTQPQTQVMSPSSRTSSATRIRSTRRSTFLTATTISCAQMTSLWFPPVQKAYRILKHSAAAKKPKLAEFRHCSVIGKLMAGHASGLPRLQETGAELDRESVATTLFSSQSKGKRDRDTNVVHSLRDRKFPKDLWTESWLGRPRRERERLSITCTLLRLRQETGKREILTSFFRRSIRNLNLIDFSYIKQVDGQIGLREIKLACMENWNWEMGSSRKIMQQIAKKLKNWEEIVAKKQIQQDKQ